MDSIVLSPGASVQPAVGLAFKKASLQFRLLMVSLQWDLAYIVLHLRSSCQMWPAEDQLQAAAHDIGSNVNFTLVGLVSKLAIATT